MQMDTQTAGRLLYLLPSWKPSDHISTSQICCCQTDFSFCNTVPLIPCHFEEDGEGSLPLAGHRLRQWVHLLPRIRQLRVGALPSRLPEFRP